MHLNGFHCCSLPPEKEKTVLELNTSLDQSSDRIIIIIIIIIKCKYKDLELEIQRMWHMKTVVIPVVVGALGTAKKGMVENIEKVSERATMTEIQKICMLGSARILRKVLSV